MSTAFTVLGYEKWRTAYNNLSLPLMSSHVSPGLYHSLLLLGAHHTTAVTRGHCHILSYITKPCTSYGNSTICLQVFQFVQPLVQTIIFPTETVFDCWWFKRKKKTNFSSPPAGLEVQLVNKWKLHRQIIKLFVWLYWHICSLLLFISLRKQKTKHLKMFLF